MSDRRDFLATIAADDSDLPRLIYSDWLREHGEEDHADLIRVQIERAKLPPKDVESTTTRDGSSALLTLRLTCGGEGCKLLLDMPIHSPSCEWERLRKREAELLSVPALMTWARDHYLPLPSRSGNTPTWDRGFVVGVECGSMFCHLHGGTVSQFHPLRTIRLIGWLGIDRSLPPDPAQALPWLRRLELPRSMALYDTIVAGNYQLRGIPDGDGILDARNVERLFGTNPDGTPRVAVEFWDDRPRATINRSGMVTLPPGVETVPAGSPVHYDGDSE